jgi:hypothetical protein
MEKKYYNIILITLLALIFLTILFPIRLNHWWDEATYLQNAEVISLNKKKLQ